MLGVLLALVIVPVLIATVSPWEDFTARAAGPRSERGAHKVDPQAEATLERAKNLIDSHQEPAALEILRAFIAANPHSRYLDHAYLLTAGALIGNKTPAEAIEYLDLLLTDFPNSNLVGRARILMGAAQMQLGNVDAALPVLAEARSLAPDRETQRDALKMIGDIQVIKGDYVRAVQAWLDEMALTQDDQRFAVRERIHDLVAHKMDRRALTRLRDAYPTTFPGDVALIRLIELHQASGEDHLAERSIRIFLLRYPNHAYAPTATEMLGSFKSKVKASQHVIAAVLPLSGQLGPFGTEALNGVRLALDKAKESLGQTSVGLIVKDSPSDRARFRTELGELLAEYQPVAVIGPFLSRDLPAAAALGEQVEIPFITPAATTPEVWRYGSYVFSTALTYPQQAQRIVDFAMDRQGYRRFCVLHPDTTYGQELTRLFTQSVRQRGGEVIAVESYEESDRDFSPQIKRLKAEDLKRYGTTTTSKTSKGVIRVNYTPGFDAIFLPGDYEQIALIAPQLLFYDMKVPLLGSNGWNSPDLFRFADKSIEGGVFVDGFFLDTPDPIVQDFVARYRKRYQTTPSLFSALAYDATRLVLEAIRRGATDGKAVRDDLVAFTDLPTLGGPAAFGPSGTLDRRTYLIQVKQGKFVLLN
jgi:ABC-type branched-subunit amino acid transport system substrate-binding protein/predicted negative regulator of RcsB-dependent stress response